MSVETKSLISSFIPQPPDMKKKMYPHQLHAISMMEERECNQIIAAENYCIHTNVGIFADLAGYGKTLAIIGLILRDKMKWDTMEPYVMSTISNVYGNGSITKKSLLRFQKINATLIVASTSILKQWSQEISCTPLQYVVINNRKKLNVVDPSLYDIVLVPPGLYNYLINKYPNFAWKRFIYDEPTQVKIPAMRCIVAGFSWFITATPSQLMYNNHNNHNYLQSLFSNFMDYHIFQNLIIKNPDEFVKKSFDLPTMDQHYHKCFQPLYNIVKNLLSGSICNMIDAGNIEKAVRQLGGTSSSNIYQLIENEKQDYLKEATFKIEKFTRLEDTPRRNKWLARKLQIENELIELRRRFQDYLQNEVCQICLCSVEKAVLITCCQNTSCGKCLLNWLKIKNTCPNCRSFVTTDMIFYIDPGSQHVGSPDTSPERKKMLTKPKVILQIIETNPTGKFIIFSNYDETFVIIRHALIDEGILFGEITGTMETRQKRIDEFKEGNLDVLFINSIANGAGINLQEATDIILYHRMCENTLTQIIGRAYRIGRTLPLNVHHLV